MPWQRDFMRMWDFVVLKRKPIMGFFLTIYLMRRYSSNFGGMEKEVTKHGYYDPRKAEAQIQLFKDIYLKGDKEAKVLQTEGPSKKNLETFLQKHETKSEPELDYEIKKLERELESLKPVHSDNEGYKFFRAVMAGNAMEDTLEELRSREFDAKFAGEKELLVGNKPKTV